MPDLAIDLITISRQFGAGGSDLARALASRLGWPVLDREVVHRVAERLAIGDEAVERMDEQAPRRLARIAAALLVLPPEAPVRLETESIVDIDAVARAARAVIVDAARTPPLIIVGHGGQCLFQSRSGAFHIRVVAPVGERIRRVAERLATGASLSEGDVERVDADRHAYVQRYFHCDWSDPLLYDVQINTSRVSIDAAADAVASLVRAPASRAD